MILSLVLLFLMLLIITLAIFYLFCFFIPALKFRYEGINDSLATELQFADTKDFPLSKPDVSKIAVIASDDADAASAEKRLLYKGEKNCRLFHSIYSSEYVNPNICIGFGDCIEQCPQKAISIQQGKAVVSNLCDGCGDCLSSCPVHLISLAPRTEENNTKPTEKCFKFWYAWYTLLKQVKGR